MTVNILIYFYLFICFVLFLYNIIYIFQSDYQAKAHKKKVVFWHRYIFEEFQFLENHHHCQLKTYSYLKRKLVQPKELLAYIDALELLKEEKVYKHYLQLSLPLYQHLAIQYKKKESLYRTLLAHTIAYYSLPLQGDDSLLVEILLSYLDDSTLNCREKVFYALFHLGNIGGIENAISRFNDEQWFHHEKLLLDGLLHFQGHQDELITRLWSHYGRWNQSIIIAIIHYITEMSGHYHDLFLPLLDHQNTDIEIKIAILRYFGKYPSPQAREYLYDILDDPQSDVHLVIVAVFVLDQYQNLKSIRYLKKALHHSNWYVRYNAAHSLASFQLGKEFYQDVFDGDDCFAREMLNYMFEKEKQVVNDG